MIYQYLNFTIHKILNINLIEHMISGTISRKTLVYFLTLNFLTAVPLSVRMESM